jgi:hypothetical protein
MGAMGGWGVLMAALVLVVSLFAGGCASPTESAQAYTYGYNGAVQQYRYEGEDVPSEWQPVEEGDAGDDRLASAPPPTRATGGESEFRDSYVYRGGRDPHTDKAPTWAEARTREGG